MATNKYILNIKTKGAKASQKAIQGVGGSLGSLAKKMAVVGGAYFGAKALVSGIKASTEAFGEQEKAEKMLEQALGSSTKALREQASALQQNSTFGDEAIIQQQAYLASIGMTEAQIKEMIPVAMDLASATGMTLEGAVKNTSKTLSGMTGELGESVPALRNLTAEQLKAGEGVKLLGEQFKGMAETEAKTFSGGMQQMKNSLGDLAEVIGSGLAPSLSKGANFIKEFAEKGQGFVKMLFNIDWGATATNLFNNIGVIGQAVLDTMSEIFDSASFRAMFGKIWTAIKWAFETAVNGIVTIAGFIFEPIINAGQKMGSNIANFFIEAINDMKRTANKVLSWLGMKEFTLTPKISTEGLDFADSRIGAFFKKQTDGQVSNQQELTSKVKGIWTDALGGIVQVSETEGAKIQSNLDPNIIMGGSEDGTPVEDNLGGTKDKWEASFSNVSELAGQFTSSISSIYGTLFDKKKQRLDADQEAEIEAVKKSTMSEEEKQKKIDQINKTYKKKEIAEKKKLLPVKLADATSSIALGIAKALGSAPPPFNIALAGLTATAGALQLSTIASSQYARGGLVTGNPHSMGGQNINAEGGEFVMSKDAVNRIGIGNLSAMNKGRGSNNITINITAPLVDESVVNHIVPAINKAIKNNSATLEVA